jgi:flagellar L-ring protein precursor FlgH
MKFVIKSGVGLRLPIKRHLPSWLHSLSTLSMQFLSWRQSHRALKPLIKTKSYLLKLNFMHLFACCSVLLTLTQAACAINLFDETLYRPLIADRKATLPGDILTVIVLETSNAQTSTDLSSGKDVKTALEAGYNKNNHEVQFGLKGKGHSAAKTGRNGKIKASLTVRIKELLPNKTYLVEGIQLITINGEQQKIVLSGIVRPEDISPQNTVLSTRLADAQITYTGHGSVSNSQDRNYIYKILSFVGLV